MRWIDEHKEQYKKYLQSQINRLERKIAKSEFEQKKLNSLKKKLQAIK